MHCCVFRAVCPTDESSTGPAALHWVEVKSAGVGPFGLWRPLHLVLEPLAAACLWPHGLSVKAGEALVASLAVSPEPQDTGRHSVTSWHEQVVAV